MPTALFVAIALASSATVSANSAQQGDESFIPLTSDEILNSRPADFREAGRESMSVDEILNSRPADFREAGRPLGRLPKDPRASAKAIKAEGILAVTGGVGLLSQNFSGPADISDVLASHTQDKAVTRYNDSIGFVDRLAAAARNTLTYRMITNVDNQRPDSEADFQNFYVENRIQIEGFALNDAEVDLLRTATSRAGLAQIKQRIAIERFNNEIIVSGGSRWPWSNILDVLVLGLFLLLARRIIAFKPSALPARIVVQKPEF